MEQELHLTIGIAVAIISSFVGAMGWLYQRLGDVSREQIRLGESIKKHEESDEREFAHVSEKIDLRADSIQSMLEDMRKRQHEIHAEIRERHS